MNYKTTVQNVQTIIGQYEGALTLRQIYYRLVADYGLANRRSSYNQLSRVMVKAREEGDIDEYRIVDRSRAVLGGDYGYSSPEEYLEIKIDQLTSNYYERKIWSDQPYYIEVWVEKDALSRVISEVADQYRVVTAPSRGYSSYSYVKDAVNRFPDDKEIIILHFTDHDPSGLDMTRDLSYRIARYGARHVKVVRIALTYDQVRQYNLVPNPTKIADTRSPKYIAEYGNECWELDALRPDVLKTIVQLAIVKYIDFNRWEKMRKKSLKEKEEIEKILQKWLIIFKNNI